MIIPSARCVRALSVCSACVLASSGAARADVLVTNLTEPLRSTTEVGNNPNPVAPPSGAPEWSWAAQSFETDAQGYTLTSISIIAGDARANPVVITELREDVGGAIGPVITPFDPISFDGPLSPRNLVPSSPVVLAPSTRYWVVVGSQAPGDGTLGMSYANTNNFVGPGVITAYADSQDSGATWNYGTIAPYYILVVAEPVTPCSPCPGDANGDGMVSFPDITSVLSTWGSVCP